MFLYSKVLGVKNVGFSRVESLSVCYGVFCVVLVGCSLLCVNLCLFWGVVYIFLAPHLFP